MLFDFGHSLEGLSDWSFGQRFHFRGKHHAVQFAELSLLCWLLFLRARVFAKACHA